MKSARLLRMLLLLQAKSPLSARTLADELEVCERTVYRDVDALSAAGVPIFATRGAQGGIGLVDGYRKAIADLEEDEIHALYVSGSDPLADLGFGSPLGRARQKLSGALNERQKRVAEKARARIRVDQRRWGQEGAPTQTLTVLRRAVWDDQRLEITYRDRNGARTTRVIEPLGLVAKSGIWYVVALARGEFRSFRADRIVSAEALSEHFERPKDFDLDAYWSQSTTRYEGTLQTFPVRVRLQSSALDEVTAYWRAATIEEDGDDRIVRFDFPGRGMAAHQVMSWGPLVRVVEPLDLVDDLLSNARALLAHYAPASS
ncbi:MAG: YafY family transcriptional regulator [Candidatus Eremiobacteraeota bacterium]|nr:YafY family transcriptional regulator [Candidatus Eremiobacteraeota bacterium]MBV9646954.1 YafY family transcriptional regulator [Candidatus Eremiobacteraeota bacterium]